MKKTLLVVYKSSKKLTSPLSHFPLFTVNKINFWSSPLFKPFKMNKSLFSFVLFAVLATSMAVPIGLGLGIGGIGLGGGYGGIGLGLGGLSYTQRIQAYPFGVGLGVGLGHPGLLYG